MGNKLFDMNILKCSKGEKFFYLSIQTFKIIIYNDNNFIHSYFKMLDVAEKERRRESYLGLCCAQEKQL